SAPAPLPLHDALPISFNENWTAKLGLQNNIFSLETNILGNILLNLKALEEAQAASIHADPRVLVSDGQSAELFVGDRQILLLAEDRKSTRLNSSHVKI